MLAAGLAAGRHPTAAAAAELPASSLLQVHLDHFIDFVLS
jgi:hypothetical protein